MHPSMRPSEEMLQLHSYVPERVIEHEIKEIWMTKNPVSNPDDFDSNITVRHWRDETRAWREDFLTRASDRWNAESPNLPALERVDQKIGSSLAVTDPQTNNTYRSLLQRFDMNNLLVNELPTYDRSRLKILKEDADQQILRNPDNLAVVIKSAKSLAGDEVEAQARRDALLHDTDPKTAGTAARNDWQTKSEVYNAVEAIEKLLPEWEKLLAGKALPDPDELRAHADKLNRAFADFESKHLMVYKDNGTPPYVKYQLPATMGALAEKIASQFAAHLGQPSFSAAYGLMMEVPHSGTYNESQSSAQELKKAYGQPFDKRFREGFTKEREQFLRNIRVIKTLDGSFYDTLKRELSKFDGIVDKSFAKWQSASIAVGSGDTQAAKKALSDLYESTAQLAFQFRNYPQTIDRVLKDAPGEKAHEFRKAYQAVLDGFITAMTDSLTTAKGLLG